MPRSEINPMIFAEVVKEWQEAPHGMKGEICKRWCSVLKISRSYFYRKLDGFIWNRQKRKSPSTKGKRKNPERDKWVWEIMQIKYVPPPGVKPLSTRDALRIAVERGLVPPEAKEIHRGTIDRIAREKGWVKQSERQNRYMAEFPNQIHQFAVMQSKHFFPIRKVDDEWILIRSSKQQKKEDDLRVFVYAIADDYSGYRVSRYAVGQKNSSDNGISFLQWAWSKECDHMPFRGLPNILFMGKNPLASQDPFRNFCLRMGIEIKNPSHDPGIPKSLGKIAQTFRSVWNSFENQLFSDDRHEREISITDLNKRMGIFWNDRNQDIHKYHKVSHEKAWSKILNKGFVIDIEPGTWNSEICREAKRLDALGFFEFQGYKYQIKENAYCLSSENVIPEVFTQA